MAWLCPSEVIDMHLYFSSLSVISRTWKHLFQIPTPGDTPLPKTWIEANLYLQEVLSGTGHHVSMPFFGGVLLRSKVGSLAMTS